jgi:hypothetical protein
MHARMERLMAEVDQMARTSLQRERTMGILDSAPLLSKQLPGAGGSSLGGALSAGSGLIPRMGSSGSLASLAAAGGAGGPVGYTPRLQESRQARRPMPMGRPKSRAEEMRYQGQLPPVGTTPSTNSSVPGSVSAAPAAADEEFSQDEAASLLLALPLSRCPSNVSELPSPRVSCPPPLPSPSLAASQPPPLHSPRAAPLPMMKGLSGLDVLSAMSGMDAADAGAMSPGLRTSRALPPPPPYQAVPMTKSQSVVSVTGFLQALDE